MEGGVGPVQNDKASAAGSYSYQQHTFRVRLGYRRGALESPSEPLANRISSASLIVQGDQGFNIILIGATGQTKLKSDKNTDPGSS